MAVRHQNSSHVTGQPPSYYANNKLYKDAYSRTEWQTRTSRRIHDGFNITANYGLDAVTDDINSSPYSSPYYINGRFLSDNLVTQRGNSASVQGMKRLCIVPGTETRDDFADEDVETTLQMWQGKQIKFTIPYSGKVVGQTIRIRNTDMCTGILSIYLSAEENGRVLSETSVDLCNVSSDKFDHIELYSTQVIDQKANPRGKLYVRLEIWDEIELDNYSSNPFNTGKKIDIASTGKDNHYECVYRLADKNQPVEETYDYTRLPNRPLLGLIYSNSVSVPVDRLGNEKTGASVTDKGYRYDIFCVKGDNEAHLIIFDKEMQRVVEGTDITVDHRTENIQIAQCVDKKQNNWVYFVDGYSPLRRFKIGEWVASTVKSEATPHDPDCDPVIGASLIFFHNNRIYLSGFHDDPNLIQFSAIPDEEGPDFTTFPYRAYSPNMSPYLTSRNTPTAMVEYSSDQMMIIGKNFSSLFTTNVAIEAVTTPAKDSKAYPTQTSFFSDSVGVQSQGDICNYKGVLYSFDQKEGVRRFTGATWTVIPNDVSSYYDRVDMTKRRKLWGFSNKLYFNYTDAIDGKAKCLVWDMSMNYQQYPWFQDVDIPFCDVRFDETEELVGIHPDYPCIMSLYAEDVWRRLDTPITFERHTKYLSVPGSAGDMTVKRIHNKVLANSNRWWYVAYSTDKQKLRQTRGRDIWYRMPTYDTLIADEPVETPFPHQDIIEENAVFRFTLSHLRVRCSAIQEKVKCKTFRSQASLISTQIEIQIRPYN